MRRMEMFARPPSPAARLAGPLWFAVWVVWLAMPVFFPWVTFVPSSGWKTILWVPTVLITLGLSVRLVRWIRARNPDFAKLSFLLRVGGFYVFFPLGLLFLSWCNVGFMLPAIFTRYVAARRHEVATLHKTFHEHAGRRDMGCEHRIEGEPFDDSFHGYYCAWQLEWNALPVEGPMDIRYRASWFGRRIEYVAPYEPALHRTP